MQIQEIQQKEMHAHEVVELIQFLKYHDIEIIIDGGWGVDALLGKQTRPHADLDIALPHKDVSRLRELLKARSYYEIVSTDTRECNFVLADDKDHEIDVHSYTFDDQGTLIFGVAYPVESLTGRGYINNCPVKCITPEWMVKFHTGYELDENDYLDVAALCNHFGIELPSEYNKFLHAATIIDAIVCNFEDKTILIQQRSATRKLFPLCWDFFGGRLEHGETVEECIKRELYEESKMNLIEIVGKLHEFTWTADKKVVRDIIYLIKAEGEILLEEGKAVTYKWIKRDEAALVLKPGEHTNGLYEAIHKAFDIIDTMSK